MADDKKSEDAVVVDVATQFAQAFQIGEEQLGMHELLVRIYNNQVKLLKKLG